LTGYARDYNLVTVMLKIQFWKEVNIVSLEGFVSVFKLMSE